jgi:hypothetical protein
MSKRILVVEDQEDSRRILRDLLPTRAPAPSPEPSEAMGGGVLICLVDYDIFVSVTALTGVRCAAPYFPLGGWPYAQHLNFRSSELGLSIDHHGVGHDFYRTQCKVSHCGSHGRRRHYLRDELGNEVRGSAVSHDGCGSIQIDHTRRHGRTVSQR